MAILLLGASAVGAQQADPCAKDRAAISALEAAMPSETVDFECTNGVVKSLYVSEYARPTLPPEIGNFPNAIFVYMDGNQLTSLPPEIAGLKSVKSLYLDSNKLNELPPQIGNLKNLETLELTDNALRVLPRALGNLSSLTNLQLNDNELTEVPGALGNLANLETLSLGGNQLSTLPSSLGRLAKLTELNVMDNELVSVPSRVLRLPSLEILNLRFNKLARLNPGVASLASLKRIDLSDNALTAVPGGFGELKSIEDIVLSNNKITEISPEIWSLASLETLSLAGNEISEISDEVGNLAKLRELSLRQNQIASVPKAIGKLVNLRGLDLSSNKLKTVPAEMGELTNLTSLSLGDNQLESLPVEVGRIANAFSTGGSSLANGSGLEFPYVAIGECPSGSPLLLVVTRDGGPDTAVVNGVDYVVPANLFKPQSVTLTGAGTGPEFAVSVAGKTQTLRCQDTSGSGGTGGTVLESEVSMARSCLAGNGRIDFNIVNSQSDARYRIEFAGLSARERTVSTSRAWRMPITGRADGTYDVTITKTLLADDTTESFTQTVGVDCDQPVPVELSQEIDVIPYCVAGNGFVRYQFVNPTSFKRSYVITFEGLAKNRSTTARPYAASVSGVSARPNGTYTTSVEYGDNRGTPVYTETVTIDCQK